MEICYCDLLFSARALDEGPLPRFRGQTLRGALGMALKGLVCHSPRTDCGECILRQCCCYAVVFEGVPPQDRTIMRKYPRIPQPFVLLTDGEGQESIKSGDPLSFGLRLFGPAGQMYPYVVQAVQDLLGRGLGRDRVRMDPGEVTDGSTVIHRPGGHSLAPPLVRVMDLGSRLDTGVTVVEIEAVTPMRLQVDGRIADRLELGALLHATLRRARTIGEFYGKGPPVETPGELLDAADAAEVISSSLRPEQVRRFSSRQRRRMVFEGVIGKVAYRWPAGAPDPGPWLEAASVLHVGKATTFGFGRIKYRTRGDGHDA